MIRHCALLAIMLATCLTARLSAAEPSHDVVIYGGTSAAIAAAVQAKRMGKSVIVVSPDKHLGGLTSGGLGWTDSGNKAAIGGISREFYQRVKKHYDQPSAWRQQKPEQYSRYRKDDDSMWVFEPHVAEQIFEDLVEEYKIPVVRDAWLDRENGVEMKDGKIVSIKTLDGKTYAGKIFMDTTYEGDLMAATGVSYFVGREANEVYDETMDGVQTARARSHQFDYPVDPYVVKGDPSSGLLPKISDKPPGVDGQGDKKLQAYCFRTCLTTAKDNQVPFPKPEGYDANDYALLGRYLAGGWKGVFNKFDPAPNQKTDVNNHGGFSFDNIGMNYDYPEASYERRQEIIKEHENYQIGLLYFLANDPSVPADIQARMQKWGLSKDEFVDNHNWPHQLYIREARRMVSDFVMSEQYLRALKPTPESVGLGSYNMDSHNTQRYVDKNGHVRNEGDIQVSPGGAYPISYRSIVPKKQECANLLVPVCVSSSHIAYGSIRMEPVFMILGQSAATAASLAIDGDKAVQDVTYDQLQPRLLADGQVLEMKRKPKPSTVVLRADSLPGIVVDDVDAETVGTWASSSVVQPYVNSGYLAYDAKTKAKASITYKTKLKPGKYDVRVSYSPNANRATNVAITVSSGDKTYEAELNQREKPTHNKAFASIGQYDLSGETTLTISGEGANGYVIADAVSFVPVK
ncbi:FAD-dependent oxidoreductase [Blastopirellula retiformator]|uniref:Xanthan lyase n=2 Tax=Blastopirellula retiformator TaxID=2527970 RepID=A0A5C5VJ89_9BACT|nr:FAD-dependent oxidoreductase [Blastopirellula retiformator]TWT38666.1 Xanthan lyase precursor [Blastopirellula retiformator]